MDLHYLNHGLERLRVEEVLHLHSLWHRGPPRSSNPNAPPASSSSTNPNLRPAKSTAFKREQRRMRREQKRQQKRQQQSLGAVPDRTEPSDPASPGIEWPGAPASAPRSHDDAGWGDPASAPKPATTRPPASAEEQAKAAAVHAQQNAISACLEFFDKCNSDDEEDDDDVIDQDGDEEGSRVFEFFLRLFEKDDELRGYYEKNWEKGEFFCLVCGGIGAKLGKRFTSCLGLVQHSNSISKTKRREAHRTFGRVMCRVLGWDFNRLPSIVLDMGEPLGRSLAKATSSKVMRFVSHGLKMGVNLEYTNFIVDFDEKLYQADDVQKEGFPSHAEENPAAVAVNSGIEGEDLMDRVETREEALLKEDLDKEGLAKEVNEYIDIRNGDMMDCIEIKEGMAGDIYSHQQDNRQNEMVDLVDSDA